MKKMSDSKIKAIEKSPVVHKFIHSQEWILSSWISTIGNNVLEHLGILNALTQIEVSPALSLHFMLTPKQAHLINQQYSSEK